MSDLSSTELNQWVLQYDVDSGIPEHPPQKLDLAHWLDSDFDINKVTCRELENGLNGFGIILENVLTRKECQRIIEATERIGYGHLGTGKTGNAYRGNKRLQLDDANGKLGEEIWRRISKFVPLNEVLPDEEGTYRFSSLNSRYRFAKYFAGEGFALHVDKPTVFEKEKCSILTVNIYLNDLKPEQGGLTRFFTKMVGGKLVASAGGVAGSVMLFKQAVVPYSPVHDGEKLNSGLKYLMRTDVIYSK